MDILFKTKKLQKQCNSQKALIKAYGQKRADLIRRRLDDLYAANTLKEISRLRPTRCHELKGNRAGQLSVNLDDPYRLITFFIPHPLAVGFPSVPSPRGEG